MCRWLYIELFNKSKLCVLTFNVIQESTMMVFEECGELRAQQECFDAVGICTRLQHIFTFTWQTAREKKCVHEFCIARHYCSICWVTNFTTNERTCGTPKTIFNIYMQSTGRFWNTFQYYEAFSCCCHINIHFVLFVCCSEWVRWCTLQPVHHLISAISATKMNYFIRIW